MNVLPCIMYVRVSENCNSNCFMCHYAGTRDSYNITLDEFNELLDFMGKAGSYRLIRFTGGETLLHPNLSTMIRFASARGFKTSIISNGFLLPEYAQDLVESGLTQCIVSADGANCQTHDKLRGINGCFNNIIKGIAKIKKCNSKVILRINTVVSPFNIDQLIEMALLFENIGVDQWSIIPIKSKNNLWKSEHKRLYLDFATFIANTQLTMLGYSATWAGRNYTEINNTFENNINFKPIERCRSVDFIRFFVPDKKILFPCNCVPHRLSEVPELKNVTLCQNLEKQAIFFRNWLADNNNNICSGCEPLNVFLSDNPTEIYRNIMNF